MKKVVLFLTLSVLFSSLKAQTMEDVNKRITAIEDRIAIKNVIDTFAILADKKDIQTQVLLFTENATVEARMKGAQGGNILTGRKQIGDAFSAYLALFETVYHLNGQQTITLNGNKATAISYCYITLIGTQDGKKMKTTAGVYYNDELVKENGHWLIAKRISNFVWREVQPYTEPQM
jgi:hypothetical protein